MRKNKLTHLLEPSLRLYFVFLLLFAAVSALFSVAVAVIEAAVVAVLYLYFRRSNAQRQKEIIKYIESVTCNMDTATKDTMVNAPLPMVIFRPENDEVIWSNDRFLQLTGEREHLFDTKITAAVPDFSSRWLMEGKTECPTEVRIGERRFLVFGHLVRTEDQGGRGYLATTYWVDVTDFAQVRDIYYSTRPVVGILTVDNYEELMKGATDSARSAMRSGIDERLAQWVAPAQGLFCRYERDRYLFVFEERFLAQFQEGKFSILETVREVVSPSGIQATLSIGIGKDADTLAELFQYAALSVEMALSRGGDQAVIKNKFNFEFYGGRTKELEKRTKVKSRVMANALGELMADASRVFVMGHKYPDMDCIGAAAGVCAMARKKGAPVHIIKEAGQNPASEMSERLGGLGGCVPLPAGGQPAGRRQLPAGGGGHQPARAGGEPGSAGGSAQGGGDRPPPPGLLLYCRRGPQFPRALRLLRQRAGHRAAPVPAGARRPAQDRGGGPAGRDGTGHQAVYHAYRQPHL